MCVCMCVCTCVCMCTCTLHDLYLCLGKVSLSRELACDSKVPNLDVALVREEHVRSLQIPMKDPELMHVRQPIC